MKNLLEMGIDMSSISCDLLDPSEYEEHRDLIPPLRRGIWWWLKSNEETNEDSPVRYAPVVAKTIEGDETVFKVRVDTDIDKCCVRPVLRFHDPLCLKIGDTFQFGKCEFIVLDQYLALSVFPVGRCFYLEYFASATAEVVSVYAFLQKWFTNEKQRGAWRKEEDISPGKYYYQVEMRRGDDGGLMGGKHRKPKECVDELQNMLKGIDVMGKDIVFIGIKKKTPDGYDFVCPQKVTGVKKTLQRIIKDGCSYLDDVNKAELDLILDSVVGKYLLHQFKDEGKSEKEVLSLLLRETHNAYVSACGSR